VTFLNLLSRMQWKLADAFMVISKVTCVFSVNKCRYFNVTLKWNIVVHKRVSMRPCSLWVHLSMF
jgi:hypothetical protein